MEIHKEVTSSPITRSEEGVVVSFVEKSGDSQADSVISMCQVKSLEYIALRHICETMKTNLSEERSDRDKESYF